jgi:O-antigen ligase
VTRASPDDGSTFEGSGLRRILIALVLIKIVGLVVVFTWNTQLGFDLPKALWSRALEWPTAAVLGLAFYRYGVALLPRTRAHLLVAAFVMASAVSVVTAENGYIALFGERNRYLGLTNVIDLAVLYLAVVVAFRRRADWAKLAAAVGIAVLVSVGYGVIQRIGRDPIVWGVDPRDRPFGTLGNPDMYGHLLAAAVAACAGIVLVARGRFVGALAVLVGGSSLAMLAIIGTRGSVLALTGALAVGGAIAAADRGRAVLRSRGAMLTIATVIVLGGAVVAFTPTGQRLLSAAPLNDRVLLWTGAWREFLARPLLGWGPDSLATGFGLTRPDGFEAVFNQRELVDDEAHNWILQALATTGVVGAATLVALVVGSTWLLLRQRRGENTLVVWPLALAALAYWGNSLFSPDAVGITWIPWVIFAGTAGMVGRAPAVTPPIRRLARPLIAAVIGLSLLGAATGWSSYRASVEIVRAVNAYPASAAQTIAGADAAITLDPGRADYYNYRGLGYQLGASFAGAASDFDEAARRAPYQYAFLINLSRARLFQFQNGDSSGGGAAAAMAAAKRGVELNPRIHAPHRNYAEIALALGDPRLAFDEARIAFGMYTLDPQTDKVLASAAAQIPDRELARRTLEAALAQKGSGVLWAGLARVYLAEGNPTAARAAALRALALDPANQDAKDVLLVTGR